MASYFPMYQNENGDITESIINQFRSIFFPNDDFWYFIGTRPDGYYNFFRFKKDSSGTVYGRIDTEHTYQCSFYFSGAVTQFLSAIRPAVGSNISSSTSFFVFNPITSCVYDDTLCYVSNFPIYTDSTETDLILSDETRPPEETPEGEYFTITNMWTHGTWVSDSQPQVSGQPHYRNFRAKMVSGTFSLYKIAGIDSGALKMGIKNSAEFYDMEYSTNGVDWIETATFPFEFFYRRRINELGEFDYALTFANSKIPIFKDEETAQAYEDGDIDITQADNWTDISQNYTAINNTAYSDNNTEMGHVYTRSFFSQQYICSWQAIQQISNAMFDTTSNIFEDIKKGLECYGERIVDSVQSCMFFPIDLSQVYSNVSNIPYIFFGGYQFNLSDGVTVGKITYPDGYFDFGSFDLLYSFGTKDDQSFRDFSPYTRLFCYLPYIGWVELDSSRYMGHTVNIRYYFDTRTGMCLACLFVQTTQGQVLYDYYQGQCGVSMPITLTDHTSYANAQIQTLLGGVNDTKGNMGTVFNAGVNMAEKGLMTTGSAMALGSVGLGAIGIGATKTLYGLTQNNINNFNKTKGSSSSMLNMCLPQECMFMFEVQQGKPTDYELELVGFPSNASDLLLNFSGYLEVDSVKLSCSGATDNEKAEIIRQLQSGVYI